MTQRIDPGATFRHLGVKSSEYGGLDTFPSPGMTCVRMTSDEVTSMCPITGQPDFEVVDITYAPRRLCIESKALKLYLHSLRNTAAFVEALARSIADEISGAAEPHWVRVDVTQKARGGISIVATSILIRTSQDEDEKGLYSVFQAPEIIQAPRNFYLGH